MANDVENSSSVSNSISPHFFTDSKTYKELKRKKKKPYRYFYNATTGHSERKAFEKKADLAQQNQVARCWQAFIKLYDEDKLETFELQPKRQFKNEKIIWQYWGQGVSDSQLPDSVKLYFKSVDKHRGDYRVIRLDDYNIHEYLDLPDFVWQKKTLAGFRPAFFADLLRLALLDVYGGVWLDATIYLSAPLPNMLQDDDFFMYQRSPVANDQQFWHQFNAYYFSWDDSHKVNLLNSVIFAHKNSYVIHTCLDMVLNFWKTQTYIPHYFFFQILFDTLIKDKLAAYQCTIVDDTIPHLLVSVLDKPYNEADFKSITSQASIHKMAYIKKITPNSYYAYLLNNT